MTDHKFEPFEKVLVRTGDRDRWRPDFFQYDMGVKCPQGCRYRCVGGFENECIPYTPEVEHMVGKSMPYEPPKPPVEYELGQKVEVRISGEWEQALYITHDPKDNKSSHEVYAVNYGHAWVSSEDIRPLPDNAAQ